jgi:hypothetical protein
MALTASKMEACIMAKDREAMGGGVDPVWIAWRAYVFQSVTSSSAILIPVHSTKPDRTNKSIRYFFIVVLLRFLDTVFDPILCGNFVHHSHKMVLGPSIPGSIPQRLLFF